MRGKIVTAFIFLTMMTGAVSAAPVLDYTGADIRRYNGCIYSGTYI